MNQLTKFLVDGILNEGEQKTLAAYGGGFKPPTSGHFEVVKQALKDNPEIDEFIIYVGSGTRNGITQAEAILIWEIYQTYLPMKVKIEPSKAPIGDVLRLGKNNPQDKVYFVIGAREGNEGDLEDIKNRTRAIGGKHPNMEVKVITTKNEGMSGTNARKAAKDSFEDFAKFLPTELSDDEKETVYNIVKPVVKESLNENASYSQDIDIKHRIMQLTQHMLDKGMNIEPLPSVEFVDGDNVNAREFFGKTAYYDPNSATIVLYTEGRHPKDIVRSFSHEMIHHIQNLEGRLGNITTTNTQEDDHLNDIEAEANLKGTMTFRNWTDSLNENILPQEKFAQEKNQDYVEQALKILPNKDKYNLKDYTVEILPIDKIKPTQFGEDYINASSEYEAEQYQKYIDGEIEAEDLRREDFYPIVVDKDTMEILDGNHRHAVHTMLSIPKIKAILVSKKLNEANKPYKHKHGFDGKLDNDPFGISAYARELASGLEEEINKDIKNENIAPDHDGKSSPFGSGYKKVKENIKCSNCGWEWELSNGGDDPYLCHKCGNDNKPNLMEGRYDTITNKLSKIIFESFKDIHDRGEEKGEISLTIGPNDEDIISNEFEFDLEATVEFVDEDQYEVDGGANVGFDDDGDEVTPLLSVRFKIPKNPKWNIISFDIKDVVRHELEHLTQEGENLKSGKFMKDDQILRNLIDMELLSKAEYFKLEKEVDAMLQGMYFKAKKSKTPFKKVLNDYLDIFVDQKSISKEDKEEVLNVWRSRRKALSLPSF